MIDTILFDNWNTLVQAPALMSSDASVEVFRRSLSEQGLALDTARFVEVYRGVMRRQVAESEANGWTELDYVALLLRTLEGIGVGEAERNRLAHRAWGDYLAEWPRQTSLFPETPAVLAALRGRYRLGLVTNFMDGPTAREVFDALGYPDVFGSLVVSAEVGYLKPSPTLFERALRELGSRPESAVMVGDNYEADIVGAHAAGMRGILVNLGGATEQHLRGSDAVVGGIGGVPEAVERLARG